MDANLKTAWLAALRGGKYEQERCSIGRGTKLCCIGVGGDVAGMSQEDDFWTGDVAGRLGLSEAQTSKIVGMNDSEKKSFAEIADWIEANIPADQPLVPGEDARD